VLLIMEDSLPSANGRNQDEQQWQAENKTPLPD
jgi:hypothetical protein